MDARKDMNQQMNFSSLYTCSRRDNYGLCMVFERHCPLFSKKRVDSCLTWDRSFPRSLMDSDVAHFMNLEKPLMTMLFVQPYADERRRNINSLETWHPKLYKFCGSGHPFFFFFLLLWVLIKVLMLNDTWWRIQDRVSPWKRFQLQSDILMKPTLVHEVTVTFIKQIETQKTRTQFSLRDGFHPS